MNEKDNITQPITKKFKLKQRRKYTEEASPVAIGLVIQLLSLLISFGVFVPVLELYQQTKALPYWEIGFCQGIVAFLIAVKVEQPSWWRVIHVTFPPLLGLSLELQNNLSIQPEWFLAGFIALLLIYWTTFKTRVPLYLSSQNSIEALDEVLMDRLFKDVNQELSELKIAENVRFLDLGSGTGRVILELAKRFPKVEFVGIEYAPIPYLISRIKLMFSSTKNVKLIMGDFWKQDLSEFDIVYAYLSPAPMSKLWEKVVKEMKSNTLFISNSFEVEESQPYKIIQIEDLHDSQLLIWIINNKIKS